MKKELMNLFLFIGICFVLYLLFRNFNFNFRNREGMTDASGNLVDASGNGIAGNASAYGAMIKAASIKSQDTFLISKYRSDYETVILNLDDLLNNLMLQSTLTLDINNPQKAVEELSRMQLAKTALNSVMKFVDSSK
jgi:enoyl-[acyl-carrier-protein] reductase (NADH)